MPNSEQIDGSRVEATISPQGAILCTCGKKLAEARDGEIEWKCRGCGSHVYVSADILFYRACQTALDANNNIITLMAKRRSAA